MDNNEDGTSRAVVVTTVTENGNQSVSEQVFEGTEEEVKAKIAALNSASKDVEVIVEEIKEELN